ncbi:hypothetical protein CTEN210_09665 [Chaetoceros tenuissimus]|uniref:DUF6824 domain-containing protein n=1 Tax=Chaetoceros tenuissimus TaxID=426638 RepID=A0AAD3CZ13_9STRA|nr:hypothetical protein CTEN210_09665 [Chaetoceros tenuissimus]
MVITSKTADLRSMELQGVPESAISAPRPQHSFSNQNDFDQLELLDLFTNEELSSSPTLLNSLANLQSPTEVKPQQATSAVISISPTPLNELLSKNSNSIKTEPSPYATADIAVVSAPNSTQSTFPQEAVESQLEASVESSTATTTTAVSTRISKEAYNALNQGKLIKSPKPQDVLSYRGKGASQNPGNILFRDLVASKKRAYDKNTNQEYRFSLGAEIVQTIHATNGGRFLKKYDGADSYFQVLDYNNAVKKATFAIRDVKVYPKAKAPKATATLGKRKRKKSTGKTHGVQSRNSSSFTNSIMPVKKKLMARVESHLLSDSEEEAILKMISVGKKPNTSGTTRTRSKSGRSDEIFALIEKVVAVGAEIRFSNDSDLNLENNTEWFSPKNQKEIRLELLARCKSAMKMGLDFHEFFNQFEANLRNQASKL